MKTKEFIERVKKLGFRIVKSGSHLDIMIGELIIAGVYTDQMYVMSLYRYDKKYVINEDKLFNLIVKYTSTPIDERQEEKKIYLRHRYFRFYNGSSKYLGMDLVKDNPDLCSKITYKWMKNQFTLKEIEEIKIKFNTDLKDFEPEEVGE